MKKLGQMHICCNAGCNWGKRYNESNKCHYKCKDSIICNLQIAFLLWCSRQFQAIIVNTNMKKKVVEKIPHNELIRYGYIWRWWAFIQCDSPSNEQLLKIIQYSPTNKLQVSLDMYIFSIHKHMQQRQLSMVL